MVLSRRWFCNLPGFEKARGDEALKDGARMAGFSIEMGVPEMAALWADLLAKQASGADRAKTIDIGGFLENAPRR